MNEIVKDEAEALEKDIIFDCPHCGKSLAIDARGAGMVVTCPDCSQGVQVPGLPPGERDALAGGAEEGDELDEVELGVDTVTIPDTDDPAEQVNALTEALGGAQAKIERLVESLETVRERRRYLEKLRADNMSRFKLVGNELETIQNAMDRIVAMLQDAASENGVDAPE